jgi:hypothetical protein
MAEWVRICEESRNFWQDHRDLWELVSDNSSTFLKNTFGESNNALRAREIISEVLGKKTEDLQYVREYPEQLEIQAPGTDGFVTKVNRPFASIVPPTSRSFESNVAHLPLGTRIVFVPIDLREETTIDMILKFRKERGFFLVRAGEIPEMKIMSLRDFLADMENLQEETTDEITSQMFDIVRSIIELDIRRLEQQSPHEE